MSHFLEIEGVTKQYDGHLAVDHVSFSVPKQSIFGLLGPNGAGKTSIIRMITNITAPDSGTIRFDGEDLAPGHNKRIGYLPEERGLYKKMRVKEHLVYLLRLRDLEKPKAISLAEEWMDRFDLSDWANKYVSDLSKGMQQKVQFIATVAHHPDLLILDEPFSGLDPVNTKMIQTEIEKLRQNGCTILFSTHRMEQVEELCEQIILINQGKKVLEGSTLETRKKFRKGIFELWYEGQPDALENIKSALVNPVSADKVELNLLEGRSSRDLLNEIITLPINILRFEDKLPRLQDIFIQLIDSPNINEKDPDHHMA